MTKKNSNDRVGWPFSVWAYSDEDVPADTLPMGDDAGSQMIRDGRAVAQSGDVLGLLGLGE